MDTLVEDEEEFAFFTSDDGEHEIVWTIPEGMDYPLWYCITHKKNYYNECI